MRLSARSQDLFCRQIEFGECGRDDERFTLKGLKLVGWIHQKHQHRPNAGIQRIFSTHLD